MLRKPYRRIFRPFPIDETSILPPHEPFPHQPPRGSSLSYLQDRDYAPDRIHAVRSYYTLEQDLLRLLDYVEPADANLGVFSHRMYELLLRASTEVEANCKAVLTSNGYPNAAHWNMTDYRKINGSSRLSDYELRVIVWHETPQVIRPFGDWAHGNGLPWYGAYNAVKHDRHRQFARANLKNVVSAIAALRAVLFSQFHIYAFRASDSIGMYSSDSRWLLHEDSIFALKPPQTWTDDERYDFDWSELQEFPDRFQEYRF